MKKLFFTLSLFFPSSAFCAFPTITFSTTSGSDTAASGSGGTAVSGTGASTVAQSSSVVLSADLPDLSGVATDGSAALWVDSTSGRQFSKIVGVDDVTDTITTENFYSNTEGSRNWGIGGKRLSLNNNDSRTLVGTVGASSGWIIVFESSQTLTSSLTISPSEITIMGSDRNNHAIVEQTANAPVWTIAGVRVVLKNLQFVHSNATKTSAFVSINAHQTFFDNCIFGDATKPLNTAVSRGSGTNVVDLFNCEIKNTTTSGILINAASQHVLRGRNLYIHDCTSHGVSVTLGGTWTSSSIYGSIITANGGDGVNISNSGIQHQLDLERNTIYNNVDDGIDASAASVTGLVAINNTITDNGGYGFNGNTFISTAVLVVNYNNYGTGTSSNTLGAYNNLTAGTNDLAVDPQFTNAAGNDYSIGTNLKAKAYPVGGTHYIGAGKTTTYTYQDIGAAQRQEAGSAATVAYPFSQ